MKKLNSRLIASTAFALCVVGILTAVAHDKPDSDEKPVHSSIRVDHRITQTALPALAKISFAEALDIASKATPGAVIKGELEVEDQNLMYSFDVVSPDHVVMEVEIDAGNGRVLDVDRD